MASEKQEFAPPSQAGRTIHIQAALSKGHHSQIRFPITTPNRPEFWRADLPGNRLFKSNHNKKSTQTAAQVDQQNRVCGTSVYS